MVFNEWIVSKTSLYNTWTEKGTQTLSVYIVQTKVIDRKICLSISLVHLWFDPKQIVKSDFILLSKPTWVGPYLWPNFESV